MLTRRTVIAAGIALPVCAVASPTTMRVILLGQSLLQNALDARQWPQTRAFKTLFAGADVCFTDLETSIRGPHAGAPTRKDAAFLHAADASVIDCLSHAGIDLFATSNNHAFDVGAGGVIDTIAALEARGLSYAGTGADLTHAAQPGFRDTAHGKVALVAMASGNIVAGGAATPAQPGVNEVHRDAGGALDVADVTRYLGAIREAAARADIVLAYHHNHYWEKNIADTPPWQHDLARQTIDAGASLFVSHGAPLLQGIEIYKGKPLFYDLGSFFFQTVTPPDYYPPEVWQSVVVDCRLGKSGFESITLLPVELNDTGLGGASDMVTRGAPSLATGDTATQILKRLQAMSAPYGTKIGLEDGKATIVTSDN